MKTLVLALLGTLLSFSAQAEDVVLKCKTAEGLDAVDLTVNLENKEMSWGQSKYTIIHVDSDYITALLYRGDNPGGEIWLLHRSSGKYWRASVGEICRTSECKSTYMAASTYEGTCKTNML